MRVREDNILRMVEYQDAVAGRALSKKTLQPFFTVLADYVLKKDCGTLGIIIPYAACVSSTSAGQRRFLADRFEVSIIVTSHDPSRESFSENTSIHECLIVCHRRPRVRRKDTLFVSLSQMPASVNDVIDVTDAILREDVASKWFNCARWPKNLVCRGDWSPTRWLNLELAEFANDLSTYSTLKPLSEIAHFGPAHVRSDLRNPSNDPSEGPYRVLWRHQTGKMRTMWATWEAQVAAKAGHEGKARTTLRPQASRLLIANNLRTTTTRVTSVLLDEPSFGSQWTPLSPTMKGNERLSLKIQKAWCVWLNSALGVLGFLHRRGRTLTYSDFMPNILRTMPCPDPSASDISLLAATYDELRLEPLLPWHSMTQCPVRKKLDNAVADAIGMDRYKITNIRNGIVQEPTVSGIRLEDND